MEPSRQVPNKQDRNIIRAANPPSDSPTIGAKSLPSEMSEFDFVARLRFPELDLSQYTDLGPAGLLGEQRFACSPDGQEVFLKPFPDPSKITNPNLLGKWTAAKEAIISRVAGNIPGIVSVEGISRDVKIADGRDVLVFKRIKGQSLLEVLFRVNQVFPMPPSQEQCVLIRDIFVKVFKIYGQLHELGIIHADIKPEHILIDSSGATHIIDFGGADLSGARSSTLDGVGKLPMFSGFSYVPHYAPPEVAKYSIRGSKEFPDSKFDIYGLAKMFYAGIVGEDPAAWRDCTATPVQHFRTLDYRPPCNRKMLSFSFRAASKWRWFRPGNALELAEKLSRIEV